MALRINIMCYIHIWKLSRNKINKKKICWLCNSLKSFVRREEVRLATDLGVVCELQLPSCGRTVLPHCMEAMLHWFPKQSSRQNPKDVYNRRLLKSTPQLWKPDLSQPTNQAGVFKAGNMCAKVFEKWELGCKYSRIQSLVVGAVGVCISLGAENKNEGLSDFMGISRFYWMVVCSQDKSPFPFILPKPFPIDLPYLWMRLPWWPLAISSGLPVYSCC